MENSLKQRIIGAIVLIALAIIFLPAILKEKSTNGTFASKIPAQPEKLANYRVDTQKIDDLMAKKAKSNTNQSLIQAESGQQQSQASQTSATEASAIRTPVTVTESIGKSTDQSVQQKKKANTNTKQATPPKTNLSKVNPSKVNPSQPSSETKQTVKEKTKISEQYVDAAWVIQVASFSSRRNAINLVEKLKSKNYKAYRRQVKADRQSLHRVFVGPYIEKKDAQKAVSKVSKLSESRAMVKVFDPIED